MKFLAVSQNLGDPTPLLAAESAQMAQLVERGIVHDLYFKTDYSGAVLILDAADQPDAEKELATLPLVSAQLTRFALTAITAPPR